MIRALFWRSLRQHAVLLTVLFASMVLVEFFLVWVPVSVFRLPVPSIFLARILFLKEKGADLHP